MTRIKIRIAFQILFEKRDFSLFSFTFRELEHLVFVSQIDFRIMMKDLILGHFCNSIRILWIEEEKTKYFFCFIIFIIRII